MTSFASSSVEDELSELKRKLADEVAKSAGLEEELDLMAFENMQLRKKLQDQEALMRRSSTRSPAAAAVSEGSAAEVTSEPDHGDLLLEGDGLHAKNPLTRFPDICSGANVLAAKYLSLQGTGDIFVCGGVDKKLRGVHLQSKEIVFEMAFEAPVLAISCVENKFACGMMDGSFAVVSMLWLRFGYSHVSAAFTGCASPRRGSRGAVH